VENVFAQKISGIGSSCRNVAEIKEKEYKKY
jgi:hypothetical protein